MAEVKLPERRATTLIILIIAGEAVFFLPFVMARVFRPTLLDLFDISNTELGIWFSIYGIVAMISYLFGGTLADRFQARKLMALALWLTSLGGFVKVVVPPAGVMKTLYGFWGFTTIGLFWAAMIRALYFAVMKEADVPLALTGLVTSLLFRIVTRNRIFKEP